MVDDCAWSGVFSGDGNSSGLLGIAWFTVFIIGTLEDSIKEGYRHVFGTRVPTLLNFDGLVCVVNLAKPWKSYMVATSEAGIHFRYIALTLD